LKVFIDGFAYFSLFPYTRIIYDHLKCASRLRATLYKPTLDTTELEDGTAYTHIIGVHMMINTHKVIGK